MLKYTEDQNPYSERGLPAPEYYHVRAVFPGDDWRPEVECYWTSGSPAWYDDPSRAAFLKLGKAEEIYEQYESVAKEIEIVPAQA